MHSSIYTYHIYCCYLWCALVTSK